MNDKILHKTAKNRFGGTATATAFTVSPIRTLSPMGPLFALNEARDPTEAIA